MSGLASMASICPLTLTSRLMEGSTPLPVRAQALCVTQNLFADATTAEMVRWLDTIGEGELMSVLQVAAQSGSVDLTIPVGLFVLSKEMRN